MMRDLIFQYYRPSRVLGLPLHWRALLGFSILAGLRPAPCACGNDGPMRALHWLRCSS